MPRKPGSLPVQARPGLAYTPGPGLYGLLRPLYCAELALLKVSPTACVVVALQSIWLPSVMVDDTLFRVARDIAADTLPVDNVLGTLNDASHHPNRAQIVGSESGFAHSLKYNL
jgi:hypothetical protein